MRNKTKKLLCVLFALVCASLALIGAADAVIGDDLYLLPNGETDAPAFAGFDYSADMTAATVRVLGIPLKTVKVSKLKTARVIPGGECFGVKLHTRGVQIVGLGSVVTDSGYSEPGKDAGLETEDIILSVDGTDIMSSEEFVRAVRECGGEPLEIGYRRGCEEKRTELTPVKDDHGVYKAGIWVKDSVAGIGTVTYIIPESKEFGGLGHGICDAESGEIIPFLCGEAYDAHITGVKKGKPGDPGELRGYFGKDAKGVIDKNEITGVFGTLDDVPQKATVGIALKNKVREGDAKILCSVDGEKVKEYTAQITCILSKESATKNFIVRITDKELIEKTGGIVQGMSGSPIIQNGMLVGAVTHVLVNDPTRGYGIFIENMLKYND